MSQPARNRQYVHAGGDQLRGMRVPQRVHGHFFDLERLHRCPNFCVSQWGERAPPSHRANRRSSGLARPRPSARRRSCWRSRCARSSATIAGGRVIVRRPCLVFGDLKRSLPLVCSSERSIRNVPASALKSFKRNARSSPALHLMRAPRRRSGASRDPRGGARRARSDPPRGSGSPRPGRRAAG